MRSLPRLPLLAAGVLWLAGCVGTERSRKELTLPADRVIELARQRAEAISTVTGDGVVTIESPEQSGSSGFDLNLKKPDSILVNLNGPFGIRLGTLLFSRDRFVFYNYQENDATIGKSDGSSLLAMFDVRMNFDEVMRAFTGEFLPAGTGAPDSFYTDGESYVLVYHRSGHDGRDSTTEYRVDGQDYFVRSYRVIDGEGRPTLTAIASEPEESGGTVAPRILRIVFPGERRSLSVAYSGMEFNRGADCYFAVPESAEVHHR